MERLVTSCCELARDKLYLSPFARNANIEGIRLRGGKVDDITVILSKIVKTED